MPKITTKTKKNIILAMLGIAGLLISTGLMPNRNRSAHIPNTEEAIRDESLPLPPIGPRDEGFDPFADPFLFQLGSTEKMTGKERENILQRQYRNIVEQYGGEAPEVSVEQISGMTVVKVGDEPFATVLPADAPEYYSKLTDERKKKLELMIAQRWKSLLEIDLAKEAYARSEDNLATYPYLVALIFFLCLILHSMADFFARKFLHSPGWSLKSFIWLLFLSAATSLHPLLKPFAIPIIQGGLTPIFLFLLVFTTCGILYRIGCRFLDNYARAYIEEHTNKTKHLEQRVETMSAGGRFLIGTLVLLLGFLWMMGSLGVDLAKIFAGAGFAGVAIGVVGKDILIDYFFGINILIDDQFNIGDFIETPVATGTVEAFNLRTTRIREVDGGLSYVTNGKFSIIKNHSREFANTDFRIGVAYGSDTDRCVKLICEEIKAYSEETKGLLRQEPLFIGVHELADSAVVLRALVRTAALSQWEVGRELNRRVLHRFQAEEIEIPFPQRTVWMAKNPEREQDEDEPARELSDKEQS